MMQLKDYDRVRRLNKLDECSIREIHRQTGLHRNTIRKMLKFPAPPGYRRKEPCRSKLDPFKPVIDQILLDDKRRRRKERHTAKRIFIRLRDEYDYKGKYTIVKDYVRKKKMRMKEVFFPLTQRPGSSQTDFGEAEVVIAGKVVKGHFFVMALSYSDDLFVKGYPTEAFEAVADGHKSAYEYFEGVPPDNRLDNAKTMVKSTHGEKGRELTDNFIALRSHYIFRSEFCNVRRPNEKGIVERLVGYARRNYLVPRQSFPSWDELNAYLLAECNKRRAECAARKKQTIGELFEEERGTFLPLPEVPFEACRYVDTRVSSLSLVRFKNNDYSVPVEYAYRDVTLKAFPFHVEVCHKDAIIAVHDRSFETDDIKFNPLHYVPLLKKKPGALDGARPFEGWELAECFDTFRRLLEGRCDSGGKKGKREYIMILQLLLRYSIAEVRRAIEKAIECGAISYESVNMLVMAAREPAIKAYPLSKDKLAVLPSVRVEKQNLADYTQLVTGGAL